MTTSSPACCTIQLLHPSACDAVVGWCTGSCPPPTEGEPLSTAADSRWLLAHCDDGVIWGRRRDPGWALSSTVFPDVSPPLRPATLQQLRIFGPDRELLIWRDDRGLTGRWLTDTANGDVPAWQRPIDDTRLVLGTHRRGTPSGGFTCIADNAGSRHAVPVAITVDTELPLRLNLRHYLAADPDTGAVRIAVSRLLDLRVATPSETRR